MNKYTENIIKDFELMLATLGLQGETKQVLEEDKFITIKFFSYEPGRIIGKKGGLLDSLTLLLNNMLYNREKKSGMRIVIDIEGDEKKEEFSKNNKIPEKPASKIATSNSGFNETSLLVNNDLCLQNIDDHLNEEKLTEPDLEQTKKTIDHNHTIEKITKTENNNSALDSLTKPEKKLTRTQMQCRNAIKEVKRWGEPTKITNIKEEDFAGIKEFFKNEKEISISYEKMKNSSTGKIMLELVQS